MDGLTGDQVEKCSWRETWVKSEFLIGYVSNLAFKNIDNFNKPLLNAYEMGSCVLKLSLCVCSLYISYG